MMKRDLQHEQREPREIARESPHMRGLAHADAGQHPEVAERELDGERQAGRAAVPVTRLGDPRAPATA